MKPNRWKKIITGLVFALIFMTGWGMILETTAQAQGRDRYYRRDRDRDRDWDRYRNSRDRNWDWRRGRSRDRGWDRDRYRYGNSYPGRNPYYDRYSGVNAYNIARQNGYRAGLDRGRDDARDGRSYNPYNSSRYRDGDNGYRSQYGYREAYRSAFRDGFRQGYDQAYRQYARYRRW